jgi:membrane protease YdiL (CAAX protease family)
MAVGTPRNGAALPHYIAPYAAYVLVLAAPATLLSRPAAYALAFAASAATLWMGMGRRFYLPVLRPGAVLPSVLVGIAGGLAGTVLWVALKKPFYPPGGAAWEPDVFWARTVASSTVVPVFEELLFRGFLLLGVIQWSAARIARAPDPLGVVLNESSVHDVPAGSWTALAAAVSTVAFAAGHAPGEWVAACAYGLLMVALWAVRKDLLTPIVAHATTNAVLALWVRASGHWSLW